MYTNDRMTAFIEAVADPPYFIRAMKHPFSLKERGHRHHIGGKTTSAVAIFPGVSFTRLELILSKLSVQRYLHLAGIPAVSLWIAECLPLSLQFIKLTVIKDKIETTGSLWSKY